MHNIWPHYVWSWMVKHIEAHLRGCIETDNVHTTVKWEENWLACADHLRNKNQDVGCVPEICVQLQPNPCSQALKCCGQACLRISRLMPVLIKWNGSDSKWAYYKKKLIFFCLWGFRMPQMWLWLHWGSNRRLQVRDFCIIVTIHFTSLDSYMMLKPVC